MGTFPWAPWETWGGRGWEANVRGLKLVGLTQESDSHPAAQSRQMSRSTCHSAQTTSQSKGGSRKLSPWTHGKLGLWGSCGRGAGGGDGLVRLRQTAQCTFCCSANSLPTTPPATLGRLLRSWYFPGNFDGGSFLELTPSASFE